MNSWDEFVDFCRLQLDTGDYDAHIPFYKELTKNLPTEEALWLGLLYMGYYQEGSAWMAFLTPGVKQRRKMPPVKYPITTQRRNLYAGKIARHFTDLLAVENLGRWLHAAKSWEELLEVVGGVWGNGRWASYTTSELLTHLGGPRLEPTTYEVLTSSGPKKGLEHLGVPATDAGADGVMKSLSRDGIDLSPSMLESILCDWAGMNKGTFYAGRNIDRQQGRILQVERSYGIKCSTLWHVRRRVFPGSALGELHGWEGIDHKRLKSYRSTGVVLPTEAMRNEN